MLRVFALLLSVLAALTVDWTATAQARPASLTLSYSPPAIARGELEPSFEIVI
jgi:hypothetical protein